MSIISRDGAVVSSVGSYSTGQGFESLSRYKLHNKMNFLTDIEIESEEHEANRPVVKWLRRGTFYAKFRVRFPAG